jgi:signal peptidase II
MRRSFPYVLLAAALLAVDQLSKAWLAAVVPHGGIRAVIPGFFNLSHVHNRGAIFGFMNRSGSPAVILLLSMVALGALGLVIYYFVKIPNGEKLLKFTMTLILAGALGNQVDRIFRGYVIDFLDFYIGSYHWPSFNVADSCITVGAGLLVFIFFFKKGSKCSLCSSN